MTGEVEERIHKALASHALERIEHGYRLVHPQGAGISTLRLLPVNQDVEGQHLESIAEISAEYGSAGLPPFHAVGVQRLNSWAVHGAFSLDNRFLRQSAQFSIYAEQPAVHLAVQTILNAFGGQLPIGRSTALATMSTQSLDQQRAHHAMPRQWQTPLDEKALSAATALLHEQRLAASHNSVAFWAEFPLSGDCPSRAIDPTAETAILQVNVGVAHPIAGVGYLATISLPMTEAPANAGEICAALNAQELQETHFVPRLGAWGLHVPHDLPAYSCFIPATEPVPGLHMAIMWWCVRRAAWLRDRFWTAKVGLKPR